MRGKISSRERRRRDQFYDALEAQYGSQATGYVEFPSGSIRTEEIEAQCQYRMGLFAWDGELRRIVRAKT